MQKAKIKDVMNSSPFPWRRRWHLSS